MAPQVDSCGRTHRACSTGAEAAAAAERKSPAYRRKPAPRRMTQALPEAGYWMQTGFNRLRDSLDPEAVIWVERAAVVMGAWPPISRGSYAASVRGVWYSMSTSAADTARWQMWQKYSTGPPSSAVPQLGAAPAGRHARAAE